MYEIILSRQAGRYLERLDRTAQQRIIDRLEQLAKNPRDLFTKPLTNAEGLRSSRVGTWRIVYRRWVPKDRRALPALRDPREPPDRDSLGTAHGTIPRRTSLTTSCMILPPVVVGRGPHESRGRTQQFQPGLEPVGVRPADRHHESQHASIGRSVSANASAVLARQRTGLHDDHHDIFRTRVLHTRWVRLWDGDSPQ